MSRPVVVIPACTKLIEGHVFDAVGRKYSAAIAEVAAAQREVVLGPLPGAAEDVVVDIGQVLHVRHCISVVGEVPMQDVEDQVGEGVPEVGRVVRGDPAHVQADRPRAERLERRNGRAASVVQAEPERPRKGHLRRAPRIRGPCGKS